MTRPEGLDAAIAIAHEAGEVLLTYFSSDRLAARVKGWRDVVTAADAASEDLVRRRLADAYSGTGVVGEEGTNLLPGASQRWFVDPLDGTLNFSRGVPVWSVSLALFDGNQPILGVVYDPVRGETFSASKGDGAWLNDHAITVGLTRKLEDAFVHLTVDFNRGSLQAGVDDLAALAPHVLRTRNIGSAALALAYVAAGRFDLMLHRFAHPWDYGAGVLLVQEAGGVVSDFEGRPYAVETADVIAACNAEIQTGALALVRGRAETHVEYRERAT